MNKLILISIVISFAICSKSWAGELDGKYLICDKELWKHKNRATLFDRQSRYEKYSFLSDDAYYFGFKNNKTVHYFLKKSNEEYEVAFTHLEFVYEITNFRVIFWDVMESFYDQTSATAVLDRQSLELEFSYETPDSWGKRVMQCKLSSKEKIISILENIASNKNAVIQEEKKEIKEKMKKNKI